MALEIAVLRVTARSVARSLAAAADSSQPGSTADAAPSASPFFPPRHVVLQKRLADLIQESQVLGGLLVLHNPALMMEMCCTNVATGQPCVPPLGQFHKAAARLGFTQEQFMQLRQMLQQYNRSMLLQLQEGLDLLELSQDNLLQTAAMTAQTAARAPAEEEDPKHTSSSVTGQPAAVAVVKGSDSSQHCTRSSLKSSGEHVSSETAPGKTQDESGEQEADFAAEDVSDSLDRHLGERMEVMQVCWCFFKHIASAALCLAAAVPANETPPCLGRVPLVF